MRRVLIFLNFLSLTLLSSHIGSYQNLVNDFLSDLHFPDHTKEVEKIRDTEQLLGKKSSTGIPPKMHLHMFNIAELNNNLKGNTSRRPYMQNKCNRAGPKKYLEDFKKIRFGFAIRICITRVTSCCDRTKPSQRLNQALQSPVVMRKTFRPRNHFHFPIAHIHSHSPRCEIRPKNAQMKKENVYGFKE